MFPLITIAGEPYARGHHYGRQAAPLIGRSIASYARLFAYRRGEDWQTIQERAQAYLPVLKGEAPDLLAEMQGIADGSERDLAEIVALNARTELLAIPRTGVAHPGYAAASTRNRAAGVPDGGECTTVAALPAATVNGTTLLAQNWDWNGDQRAACILLRVEAPGQPALLTLTEAGMLAKIGLNRAGLGVCLNILHSRDDGKIPGLPVHVLLRLLLQTASVEQAMAAVERVRPTASSCITVADAEGHAAAGELTPGGISVLEPQDGLLVHTNHCVADTTRAGECALDPLSSSIPRYNRAAALLAAARPRIDHHTMVELLRDHDGTPLCICRHPQPQAHPADRVESVAGVVMDLGARELFVAPGVPCMVGFEKVGV